MQKTTNRNNRRTASAFRLKAREHFIDFMALIVVAGLGVGIDHTATRSNASGLTEGPTVSAVQDGLTETEREQQFARDAENVPMMFEYRSEKKPGYLEPFLGVIKPLFIGVDDVTIPAFLVDPADASTTQAFTGVQVWGAAYDSTNNRVLFNSGSVLWEWPVGGMPNQLGTIVDGGGATQSMVSLAWHDGQLYGTKNITTEAVYQIDATTRVATILITYPTTHDMGGLAVDPNTGFFYATDDGSTDSLVRINNDGTVTPIAPYPTGETDIDGLAISNDGRAYLVVDQPGNIYVYDLVGGAYLPPFANPWTTSEIFSGATWIQAPSAMASISGQTVTPSGTAIGNVVVNITDGASFTAIARSNPFGYFRFEGVPTGPTYTLTGSAKLYTFTPLNLPVTSDVTGLMLTSDAP